MMIVNSIETNKQTNKILMGIHIFDSKIHIDAFKCKISYLLMNLFTDILL